MMMRRITSTTCTGVLVTLAGLLLTAAVGAAGPPRATESVHAGALLMQFPEAFGPNQRPLVLFDHTGHTDALGDAGCTPCHASEGDPTLKAVIDVEDREGYIDAIHDACISCHQEPDETGANAGPTGCGQCHVRRGPLTFERVPLRFDLSLHGLHNMAFDNECETCHHATDVVDGELVYVLGEESACSACHEAESRGGTRSLADASHASCLSCHSFSCKGCHTAEAQRDFTVLEDIPRLERGQPDTVRMTKHDGDPDAVDFNHLAHESVTASCSDCHHRTLNGCRDCHTPGGSEAGAGVTTERAFHTRSSSHSCIGCHAKQTDRPDCAGCHGRLVQPPPSPHTCTGCHADPQAASQGPLAALPEPSDAFPETVIIDSLSEHFEPSHFPHARIVAKLDTIVRSSPLATRLHGRSDVLCAGCHHHGPVAVRPSACRGCHDGDADAASDKPGLEDAYHRQCIGCHIEMNIGTQGCTDCHAAREVQS